MIFKRESLHKFIERSVLESIDPDNNQQRIVEIVLSRKEWATFMKEYKGHDGSYGSKKVHIRFALPLKVSPLLVEQCRPSEAEFYTHEVLVRMTIKESPNEF
jgi:hypothetical protein